MTDPIGTHRLLWAVSDALTVDNGTGLRDLRDLADQLGHIDLADDVRLPAVEDDTGPIPVPRSSNRAQPAPLPVSGRAAPSCRTPALPDAQG